MKLLKFNELTPEQQERIKINCLRRSKKINKFHPEQIDDDCLHLIEQAKEGYYHSPNGIVIFSCQFHLIP